MNTGISLDTKNNIEALHYKNGWDPGSAGCEKGISILFYLMLWEYLNV